MESNEVLSGVASVIPEGYVDIIRRVIPGAMLWVSIYFVTGFPHEIKFGGISAGGFVLFLLVAYASGLVIDALVDSVTRDYFFQVGWTGRWTGAPGERNRQLFIGVLSLQDQERERLLNRSDELPDQEILGRLNAVIIAGNPQAGIVLPKLVAEECMLRNLACALFPVLVMLELAGLKLIHLESVQTLLRTWALFALVFVCSVLALVASGYRARRTVSRTLEWAYLADRAVRSRRRGRSFLI